VVSAVTKNAVELGDRAGTLGDSLADASQHAQKTIALKKKITGAAAYPLAIMAGTICLVIGLIVFVFPKIVPLFESLKVSLPLSTRLLIGFSKILTERWYVVLISVFLVPATAILTFRLLGPVQKYSQYLVIRLPLVGPVVRLAQNSFIFESLHSLVRGGEQLSDALQTVSGMVKHYEYKMVLAKTSDEVREGRSCALLFSQYKKLFPAFVPGIILTGEKTGNLEVVIKDISEIVRTELEDRLKALTTVIEPALMISMSLLIGFIALSIILPIYGITSHFQTV
jgi:type II secretory pathway component PulF